MYSLIWHGHPVCYQTRQPYTCQSLWVHVPGCSKICPHKRGKAEVLGCHPWQREKLPETSDTLWGTVRNLVSHQRYRDMQRYTKICQANPSKSKVHSDHPVHLLHIHPPVQGESCSLSTVRLPGNKQPMVLWVFRLRQSSGICRLGDGRTAVSQAHSMWVCY